MKKTALLIMGGALLGIIALYLIDRFNGKAPGLWWGTANPDAAGTPELLPAPKKYPALKMQVALYKGQTLYPNEVEVLQKYINVYDGAATVPVTGIYDEFTENAVSRITGKGVTTLYEFRFSYMGSKGLNDLADKIVKGEA